MVSTCARLQYLDFESGSMQSSANSENSLNCIENSLPVPMME